VHILKGVALRSLILMKEPEKLIAYKFRSEEILEAMAFADRL